MRTAVERGVRSWTTSDGSGGGRVSYAVHRIPLLFPHATRALAVDLEAHHDEKGDTWQNDSPLVLVMHAGGHAELALKMLELHAYPNDVFGGHTLTQHMVHAHARSTMALERFLQLTPTERVKLCSSKR